MYDLIGDIHGHADELVQLLGTLGYLKVQGAYPATAKPVFVGHYWLSANRPEVLAENVACLDFSVAKGGFLCAYRWHGEQKLSNDNFVWVREVRP